MEYLKHIRTKYYIHQTKHYALYRCGCGKEKVVRTDHVRSGRTTSCGCGAKNNAKKHGMSGTKAYRTWSGIKARAGSKMYYEDVAVCDRWESFDNFFKDMGSPPTDKHEIDRIDPFGDYEPSNCRWATRSEQMLNGRRNHKIYATYTNHDNPAVPYRIYRRRVLSGWEHERAINSPKMVNQYAEA